MKTVVNVFVVLSITVLAVAAGAQTLPGLLHYWQAEGTPVDIAGGNDGTLYGGAGYGPSPSGQSFDLTGAGDRVVMLQALPPMSPGVDMSISLWMKVAVPSPSWGALFETRYNNYYGFTIAVNSAGNPWFGGRCNNSSTDFGCVGPTVSTGAWHHVVAVFDWTAGETHLYVDGSWADTGSLAACDGFTYWDKIWLGAASSPDPQWELNGYVDEVQVYGRALGDDEIGILYTQSPVPSESKSWGTVKSLYR